MNIPQCGKKNSAGISGEQYESLNKQPCPKIQEANLNCKKRTGVQSPEKYI